jgi:hypothetical protein
MAEALQRAGLYLWVGLAGLLTLLDGLGAIGSITAHGTYEDHRGSVILTATIATAISAATLATAVRVLRGRWGRVAVGCGMALTLVALLATLVYLVAAWTSAPL